MNYIQASVFSAGMVMLLLLGGASSAQDSESGTEINYSTSARPVQRSAPKYPRGSQSRGEEGWVIVSFVVQSDGEVTDPLVDSSSGILDFERAAMKAVKKWEYEPATQNGVPVEQCKTKVKLTFSLSGGRPGASRKFINFYKDVKRSIQAGDVDKAESQIEKGITRGRWNHYEYAQIALLTSFIAEGRGDERAQLEALRRTAGVDGDYIDSSLLKKLLPVILGLELRLSEFSDAIATYEDMKEYPELIDNNEVLVAAVTRVVDAIQADRPISIPAQLIGSPSHGGRWSYTPFRNKFAFDNVNGALSKLELRCDWKHFSSVIETDQYWQIPESWGQCELYVFGDSETTFNFIEYKSPTEVQSMSHQRMGS